MSWVYDNWILQTYKTIKHFPTHSGLLTTPKKNQGITELPGKANGKERLINGIVYGIIATTMTIIIIASVINYEVMFREKGQTENEEYTKDYYSKPENATGQPIFVTLLLIMGIILFLGLLPLLTFKMPIFLY